MKEKFMKKLGLFLKGIVVGVANIIPGVSGGTMAVIMNVYNTLVDFLSFKISVIKKKWADVLALALGMGAGILALSYPIKFLLNNFGTQCNFFFAGVVLGSIPMLFKRARRSNLLNGKHGKIGISVPGIICFVITLAIMIVICIFSGGVSKEGSTVMENSFMTYMFMIPAGMFAAVSMIIPGISGSFIMLVIGAYGTIISALSFDSFNILIILCFALGAVIGIVLGARLISFLLKKFPEQTYMGILGLIVGSIPFLTGFGGLILCALLVAGTAITYIFGKKDPENKE